MHHVGFVRNKQEDVIFYTKNKSDKIGVQGL
jgi:hypothetical protein